MAKTKKHLLIRHVHLWDGTIDMALQKDVDILIEGDTILQIGAHLEDPIAQILDGSGKFATPGLINLHVHLPSSGKVGKTKAADKSKLVAFVKGTALTRRIGVAIGATSATAALLSGTTTIRAVGGVGNFDTRLRNEINKGFRRGPRIITANEAICPEGGHMAGTVSQVVHSEEEAIAAVERRVKEGVDFVKIMITGGILDAKTVGHPGDLKMDLPMTKAICDAAHAHGLKVAAHVEGAEGMEVAIQGGVDTIEHGAMVSDELFHEFIARGGVLVATISPAIPFIKLDPRVTGYDQNATINSTVLFEGIVGAAKRMLELGGTVGLGTDTGCPYITHYNMWRELVYYAAYVKGVTPSFALHTATQVNAQILGIGDEVGTIEPGKIADLVLLDKDPMEDLTAFANPFLVIAKGQIYRKKPKKFAVVDEALDHITL